MKKVVFLILLLSILSGFAKDYRRTFYELFDQGDYSGAEAVVEEWESAEKDNPDAIAARFNLAIENARSEMLVLSADDSAASLGLILADKDGNPAGGLFSEVVWDDSLANEAIKIIDRGIELYPDRLDFRFGKATLNSCIKDWDAMTATAIAVLDRAQQNGSNWLWTDNEVFADSDATEKMLDTIHEYERNIASNSDSEALLDRNIEYYPEDAIALTLKGVLAYNREDDLKALEYTSRAHKAAPDDMLIVCNLALVNKQLKNYDEARRLYNIILDNPDADQYWKDQANFQLKSME